MNDRDARPSTQRARKRSSQTRRAGRSPFALGALLAIGTTTFVSGCLTPDRTPPKSAVYCPECEIVWVEAPELGDPYRLSTTPREVMQCRDCENAVLSFFKTGKFGHTCKSCGSGPVHCQAH